MGAATRRDPLGPGMPSRRAAGPPFPPNQTADNLSRARERYAGMRHEPSRTRYGWVRRA